MDSQVQPVTGTETPLEGRCGSKLRGKNRYCAKYPIPAKTRCELHGGYTPMGMDLPQTKSGGRSKYLPARLQPRYEELLADPKALALGADLALLDTRLTELLERLDTGESEAGWSRLKDAFKDLRGAMAEGDGSGVRSAIQRLQGALNASTGLEATWRDVRELLQERRLLAESERRRLVDLHQMVTIEELLLFMGKLSEVIRVNVDDPHARMKIGNEIQAMLNAGGRTKTVASRVKTAASTPTTYSGGVRASKSPVVMDGQVTGESDT